jgi:hypothetical protein
VDSSAGYKRSCEAGTATIGGEQKTTEIDCYLCSRFNENDGTRLRTRIEDWFKLPYLTDRKSLILDSLEAHRAGKWMLRTPDLEVKNPMPRKKRNSTLTPEQLAVLRSSPNQIPCEKFRKANIFKFMKHVNDGKCMQCIEFFRMLDRERQLKDFLRESRN